jgi:outer membrane lipoprotein-sorting protein
MVLATLALGFAVSGCGPRTGTTTKVPAGQMRQAMEATPDELIAKFNAQARAVRTLRATATLTATAGSSYSGEITNYHDFKGFILAQRPAHIRVIGQAPVVAKNIFDMVSDGETFRIFIPSKNKFLVGPTTLERPSKKPIENLRPQHLLDALFWPVIAAGANPLFEEVDEKPNRYYVLTELREDRREIARKIWFDRADLSVARVQVYMPNGKVASDVRYSDWAPVADVSYPREIRLARPQEDYQLAIKVTQLTLNEEMGAERFKLEQPAGTELVRVGEGQS